ncbi:hypothetical protein T01_12475 [Trichinella spiralis]|uniref:Uncharacterized protein n=1 Tax=Trichinella spiralis TaxID=6334 RepID=A0A0V1AJQ6_TRISP|nr:hypothetical protein T01_12475 [Trichinella spiralis]
MANLALLDHTLFSTITTTILLPYTFDGQISGGTTCIPVIQARCSRIIHRFREEQLLEVSM